MSSAQATAWLKAKPRNPAPPIDPTVLDLHDRLDWEHFAAYGWDDETIAARLGYTLEALQARSRRT